MKFYKTTIFLFVILFVMACSSSSIVVTKKSLPIAYGKKGISVSLFKLNNYTDTPRAGMRASNIIEGILLSLDYRLTSHLTEKLPSLKKAAKIAKEDGSKYFMYGGVSEWRYKTGIDGEPAVSLQISLYKTKKMKLIWSATGSDNDWGNASIGTTAQNLILEMMSY